MRRQRGHRSLYLLSKSDRVWVNALAHIVEAHKMRAYIGVAVTDSALPCDRAPVSMRIGSIAALRKQLARIARRVVEHAGCRTGAPCPFLGLEGSRFILKSMKRSRRPSRSACSDLCWKRLRSTTSKLATRSTSAQFGRRPTDDWLPGALAIGGALGCWWWTIRASLTPVPARLPMRLRIIGGHASRRLRAWTARPNFSHGLSLASTPNRSRTTSLQN